MRHGSVYNLNSLSWQGQPTEGIVNHSLSFISYFRYNEIKKQPRHPEDGSSCSQTFGANYEVKGRFSQTHTVTSILHSIQVRRPKVSQPSSLKELLPSSGHMRHCTLHCTPAVSSLTGSIHPKISCIVVMQQEHCGVCGVTHTFWCDFFFFFPPSVLSLWVVTCPGTVRGCWGRVGLLSLLL